MLVGDFESFVDELEDNEEHSATINTISSLNVPVSPLKSMNTSRLSNMVTPSKMIQATSESFTQLNQAVSNIPLVTVHSLSNQSLIPVPVVQNIVSTCNLGTALNLQHLATHARNAEYNPKRFAAVIMRIRDPRTTALIFSSGKMVVTGANSEDASRLAARKYARIVQKLGFSVKFMDFKLQNIVGSVDVKFAIQLEGLFITHNQFCTYEPELFPGLVYRMVVPRVVLLIFVSGKIVITGAKTRDDIGRAFGQIYPIVKGFKK